MADHQYDGQARVQVLLDFLQERHLDLDDVAELKRAKLEQTIQLCQLENDATQVSLTLFCMNFGDRFEILLVCPNIFESCSFVRTI